MPFKTKSPAEMSDCEYILSELRAGPRCAIDIISASIRDRSVGCTVHSRVAELRERGYGISCAVEGKTRAGRDKYVYRLIGDPEATAEITQTAGIGGAGDDAAQGIPGHQFDDSPSVGTVVAATTGGEVSPASLGAPVLGGVVAEQVNPRVVAPSATYEQLVIA